MPRRSLLKSLSRGLKEADSIAKLVTGRRLMELGAMVIDMTRSGAPADPNNPYSVLGITPGASDRLVKSAYRAAAFDFHPDTGIHPDKEKFQRATEAYNAIEKERNEQKGKAEPGRS